MNREDITAFESRDEQLVKLLAIANHCPVHVTLVASGKAMECIE